MRRKEYGDLMMYNKRERLMIDREIADMQKKIGGIVGLRGKPAALFIVDARREKTSIREANKAGVPVVSSAPTANLPASSAIDEGIVPVTVESLSRPFTYICTVCDDALYTPVIMALMLA